MKARGWAAMVPMTAAESDLGSAARPCLVAASLTMTVCLVVTSDARKIGDLFVTLSRIQTVMVRSRKGYFRSLKPW
jgi:hypothetical protein